MAQVIQKAYILALIVRKEHAEACVIWKKYALTLGDLKTECPDTHHPEGICSGTRPPESTCHGLRRQDATYLDTCHPEEICPDTLRLQGKMPWHSSSGVEDCPITILL